MGDPSTLPILTSALALLGLLWASGIFGRVRILEPKHRVSKLNHVGCPPIEATATSDTDVWEVPQDIGELTVSKLLVHPIKVSFRLRYPGRE